MKISLQQAKDEVAKSFGFHDWVNFLDEAKEDYNPEFVAQLTDQAWVIHSELNDLIDENEKLKEKNLWLDGIITTLIII